MKKMSLVLLVLFAQHAVNAEVYVAPLKVETTQVFDQSTGTSEIKFQIDGVDIELSKKDKIQAKNWNLTNADWAKYKYVMEYTPRGLWTPDIDPPLALADTANTQRELEYYLSIQNKIEQHRLKIDERRTKTAAKLLQVGSYANHLPEPRSGLQAHLPVNMTSLKSIFFDLRNCDADCRLFVTLAIAGTSNTTKLDIHATGGNESELRKMLTTLGIDDNEFNARNITLNAQYINETLLKTQQSSRLPFYIYQSDQKTSRREIE